MGAGGREESVSLIHTIRWIHFPYRLFKCNIDRLTSLQIKMPWQIHYNYVHIKRLSSWLWEIKLSVSLYKEKGISPSDLALKHIPTDMCLEVPKKKYVSMGKKAA